MILSFLLHRTPDIICIGTGGSNQTGIWLQSLAAVFSADYNIFPITGRNGTTLSSLLQFLFKVFEIIFKAVERPLVSVFHTCLAVFRLPKQTMSCPLKFVDKMVEQDYTGQELTGTDRNEINLDRNWLERVEELEAISKLIGCQVVYLDWPHSYFTGWIEEGLTCRRSFTFPWRFVMFNPLLLWPVPRSSCFAEAP